MMEYKQAISIIDGVIENAWLNLHEGHAVSYTHLTLPTIYSV